MSKLCKARQTLGDRSQNGDDYRGEHAYTGPGNCRHQDKVSQAETAPDALFDPTHTWNCRAIDPAVPANFGPAWI
ncbi:hypothetical protein [Pseudomonas sp. NyZ201]|uniref:hypothetical protein n=1 Tax=Pseudomonas sp. NyZ201 TaxID=3409857 RepID=UPI003CE6F0FD